MNENYTIPHALLQEVVTFLSQRPYVDVFKVMPKLTSLEPIPEPDAGARFEPEEPSSD